MNEEKPVKSKFKIGQKVWYIGRGYVDCEVIRSIFINKWDDVLIGFYTSQLEGDKHSFDSDDVFSQDSIYPTKDALIKHIKSTEV